MVKSRLERLILFVSLLFIFSGCGYKFIARKDRSIFIMPVLNSTVQPRVDIYLAGELRKTLVEYPGFSIVNGGDEADCTLQVKINKWERLPLFFSKEGDSEIIIAKFRVETEICISEHGRNTFTGSVADTFPASLAVEYREDEVLQKISGKLAEKIYFYLLDKI